MTSPAPHPSRNKLTAYESGSLDDQEAMPIERHVGQCELCRRTMEHIRASDLQAKGIREIVRDPVDDSNQGFGSDFAPGTGEVSLADAAEVEDGANCTEGTGAWLVPDYERIKLCGEGSYGTVWAVRDRVGVYRALKIIDMKKMVKSKKLKCRESIALETYCKKVSRHPHLIGVYHVGMVGNQLYYTMDLADNHRTKEPLDGEFPENYRPFTLDLVMKRRQRPDVALEIIKRLLGGLAELHKLDLVHRDIKPSNVVFVRRTPRLADIGMVSMGSDSGAIVGTPRYMPPDRIIDKTADTYAIAKILHELVAGKDDESFPHLPDDCLVDSMKWNMQKVSDLIVRACKPDASDRYQSANEMLEDLEACGDQALRTFFEDMDQAETCAPAYVPVGKPFGERVLFSVLDNLPHILGFILVLYLIYRLTS